MPQTQSRFFDDLSRLMTDAAGLADGARRRLRPSPGRKWSG